MISSRTRTSRRKSDSCYDPGVLSEHTIIAEESGAQRGSAEGCWLVDPLDGTVNYAHQLPFFSVSIAFALKTRCAPEWCSIR